MIASTAAVYDRTACAGRSLMHPFRRRQFGRASLSIDERRSFAALLRPAHRQCAVVLGRFVRVKSAALGVVQSDFPRASPHHHRNS
jgi:hypothetical protein